jgi:hypothetical protein
MAANRLFMNTRSRSKAAEERAADELVDGKRYTRGTIFPWHRRGIPGLLAGFDLVDAVNRRAIAEFVDDR